MKVLVILFYWVMRTTLGILPRPTGIDIESFPILDPRSDATEEKRNQYAELFFKKRGRKGFNSYEAKKIMRDRNYFGCMMVECGDADAMISGLTKNYPDTIRPACILLEQKMV